MTDCCATNGLLSVDAALERLLQAAVPVTDTEDVPLATALGRVLAQDIASRVDVPPADNSAMDGFALRLPDLQQSPGHRLPVVQRIAAGHPAQPLAADSAARIFTGAEIPAGADTVVMQEDCEYDENRVVVKPEVVAQLKPGDNVRPRGQDLTAGHVVVTCGTPLTAAHMGVIAAAGHAVVPVVRRVRVAILSTGDELLEPDEMPAPGRIFNSNRYALIGYLVQLGCEVVDLGVVRDRRDATEQALRDAAARADLVITTGGASVGEEDHLRAALCTVGRVDLWKIAIKPGKPLMFGEVNGSERPVPLIGLPGNPVSVAVTFLVFALPFVHRVQGMKLRAPPPLRLPAGFRVKKAGSRTEFLRVRVVEGMSGARLERFENQSSGVLTSMAWADGFAVIPAGSTVEEGDPVAWLSFAGLLTPA